MKDAAANFVDLHDFWHAKGFLPAVSYNSWIRTRGAVFSGSFRGLRRNKCAANNEKSVKTDAGLLQ